MTRREDGDRRHLAVVSDLDANVVIEFVVGNLDRRQLLGRAVRGWRESNLLVFSEKLK